MTKVLHNLRLMAKAEVLELTGVTYVTIWNWMRDGLFPLGILVGGQVRWHRHEVEAWFAACPRQKPLPRPDKTTRERIRASRERARARTG